MNALGVSTWIWVSPLTDERLATLAPKIRELGFDLVELPVEHPGDWNPAHAAEVLASAGLAASVAAVMPAGRDLLVDDEDVLASTADYLRHCVDVAVAVGSGVVGGPVYSAVGRTWALTADERARAVRVLAERLRPLAAYAAERGVRLALEPLNRYETSFVNTVEQGLEIVVAVDSPGLGLLLDTYHLNIEERDLPAAIRSAGAWLAHVHACANDRGSPGRDHLDWPAIARALRDVRYEGALCIESFVPDVVTIARAASIWRPLAPTQDDLAYEGLVFLRRLFDEVR